MITPTAIDWDRDGDIDLIVGDEDGRVAFVENTGTLRDDRTPQFLPPRYFQQEADDVKFGALATPFGFDWDGDGDTDIISGNTAGYIGFIENLSGPGVERPRWAAPSYARGRRQGDPHHGRPERQHPGPVRGEVGLHHAERSPTGTATGCRTWSSTRSGARSSGIATSAPARRPSSPPARPIEVEWDGPAAGPGLGLAAGPRARRLLTQWRTTPGRRGLERRRSRRPRDARPRGLSRVLRAGAPRRARLVLLPPRRVFVDEAGPARSA